MAENENVPRRRTGPQETNEEENFFYGQALEWLTNFVDRELGNGNRPQEMPDTSEWKKQRIKTIRTLNDLRKKLDSLCKNANIGKAAGAGAGAGGAALSIAGAAMAIAKLTPAGPVIQAGCLIQNAGTIVGGISAIIEILGSAEYLREIEAVLEKDKELSRPLAEWLIFSNQLDGNIREIFGASLSDLQWSNVSKVFYEFAQLSTYVKGFDAAMSLVKRERWSLYIGNEVKAESLRKFFEYLSLRPELANKVRVAFSVLSVSSGAIHIYTLAARVINSLRGISYTISIPSLEMGPDALAPTGGEVAFFCGFQMLLAAVAIIKLINALDIIASGESPYSDGLKQITRALTLELRRMEQLNSGTT